MKTKPLPPLKYLNECFALSETSPSGLIWKVRPLSHFSCSRICNKSNTEFGGKVAGSIPDGKNHRYWSVKVAGNLYLVHRIIYAIHNNIILSTEVEVDHRDGDKLNNRPPNLREAAHGQNQQNGPAYKNNTSGFKGVVWSKMRKCWVGVTQHNKKYYSTRGCLTAEKAHELLTELRSELHKEFAHHG